jgi:hypothetical protein
MLRPKRLTPSRRSTPDLSAGNPLHGLRTNFVEWTVAIGLSPETARIRNGYFIRWCDSRHVDCPRQVSLALLESYQLFLATSQKRNGDGIAATTQAARLNPIVAFCKWLARKRLVRKDPSIGLVLPRQCGGGGRVHPSGIERVLRGRHRHLRDPRPCNSGNSVCDALRRWSSRGFGCDLDLEGLAVFVSQEGRNRVVPLGARAAMGHALSQGGSSRLAPDEADGSCSKEWTWGNGQAMERTFDVGRVKTYTLGPSTDLSGSLAGLRLRQPESAPHRQPRCRPDADLQLRLQRQPHQRNHQCGLDDLHLPQHEPQADQLERSHHPIVQL